MESTPDHFVARARNVTRLPLDGMPQGTRLKSSERSTAAGIWLLATLLMGGFVYLERISHDERASDWLPMFLLAVTVLMGVFALQAIAQLVMPAADMTVTSDEVAPEAAFEVQWHFPRRQQWVRSVRLLLEEREIPKTPGDERTVRVVRSQELVALHVPQALSGRITTKLPRAKQTWASGPASRWDCTTCWSIRTETACLGGLTARDNYDLP